MITDKLFVYSLIDGKEKVYIGLEEIGMEVEIIYDKHEKEGKKFTRVEKTSRAVTKKTALRKLEDQLKRYSYGHKGKCPRYNYELQRIEYDYK